MKISKNFEYLIKFKILVFLSRILELSLLVSKSSKIDGTYDGEEFPILEKILPVAERLVIIDVGANKGDWAINLVNVLNAGQRTYMIFCIEPIDIFANEIINKNIDNVEVFNLALGEDESKTIIIKRLKDGGSRYFEPTPNISFLQHYWVEQKRGDTFVSNIGVPPNFIKIDTDGMDFEILKSFQKTLNAYNPIIQFEFTARFARKAGYKLKDVIALLANCNYQVFVIDKNSRIKKVLFPSLEVLSHQTKNFFAMPDDSLNMDNITRNFFH